MGTSGACHIKARSANSWQPARRPLLTPVIDGWLLSCATVCGPSYMSLPIYSNTYKPQDFASYHLASCFFLLIYRSQTCLLSSSSRLGDWRSVDLSAAESQPSRLGCLGTFDATLAAAVRNLQSRRDERGRKSCCKREGLGRVTLSRNRWRQLSGRRGSYAPPVVPRWIRRLQSKGSFPSLNKSTRPSLHVAHLGAHPMPVHPTVRPLCSCQLAYLVQLAC